LDESALGQILVNLTVNAADAMPESGELTLAAQVVPRAALPAQAVRLDVDHVVLIVSDTGVGMDAATKARIFEPLFTTKPAGKGTGLGLSSVYGIVQLSGGYIEVQSAPGAGTTFRIGFPIEAEATVARSSDPQLRQTRGRILLVEDDEQLCHVLTMTLRAAGHEVTTASNVSDALLCVRRDTGQLDVLCTDAVLAQELPRALIEAFAARFPASGVVVFGADPSQAEPLSGVAAIDVLTKPFLADDLLRRVDEQLLRQRDRAKAVA
jgi:CheY-like chemotaxis protein